MLVSISVKVACAVLVCIPKLKAISHKRLGLTVENSTISVVSVSSTVAVVGTLLICKLSKSPFHPKHNWPEQAYFIWTEVTNNIETDRQVHVSYPITSRTFS